MTYQRNTRLLEERVDHAAEDGVERRQVDGDDGYDDQHDRGRLQELGARRPADLAQLGDDLRDEARAAPLGRDGLGDRAGLLLRAAALLRGRPRARRLAPGLTRRPGARGRRRLAVSR